MIVLCCFKFNYLKGKFMKSTNYFLIAAFISFVFSVSLWFLGNPEVAKDQAIFVGLWVPSILSLGNLIK